MRVGREYRDRDEVEVAILDALVNRHQSGMTVFELRTRVDVDIETIEPALANLHEDGLITVDSRAQRSVIRPVDRVIPDTPTTDDDERFGWLREKIRSLFNW